MLRMRFVPQAGDEFLPLHTQIAKRAYEIYEERGREDGYDVEDWLTAEEEIEFELSAGPFIGAAA